MIVDDIPAGTYFVTFQALWMHPHVGKNAQYRLTVSTNGPLPAANFEEMLAIEMTKMAANDALCTETRIQAISKLA